MSTTEPQSPRILVIDDEITQRMLVKEYLEEAGYQVRLSEDGRHGLKMAASISVDLIIVDAILPSVDGYTICQELRQQAKTADLPIIMITASKEADAITKGLAAGATDFLTKPFEWQFLADRVGNVLERVRHMRRLKVANSLMAEELKASLSKDEQRTQLIASQRRKASALEAETENLKVGADARARQVLADAERQVREIRDVCSVQLQAANAAVAEEKRQMRQAFEQDARSIRAEAEDKLRKAQIASNTLLEATRKTAEQQIRAVRATAEAEVLEAKAGLEQRLLRAQQAAEEQVRSARAEAELARAEAAKAQAKVVPLPTAPPRHPEPRQDGGIWALVAAAAREQSGLARTIYESCRLAEAGMAAPERPAARSEHVHAAGAESTALLAAMKSWQLLAETLAGGEASGATSFDVAAHVEGIVARLAPLCAERGVAISADLVGGDIQLAAEEPSIRHALLSLVLNAVRFSASGSAIRIGTLRQADGSLVIAVADQGVGMGPALVQRLEACLEQPGRIPDPERTGLGLGIPVAAAIARRHGGRLVLESALGQGTTATLVMPAVRLRPAARPVAAALEHRVDGSLARLG